MRIGRFLTNCQISNMKNLFKLYREWRDRQFVERINRVYFKKDNSDNLFWEGRLHVVAPGSISIWDKDIEKVKEMLNVESIIKDLSINK